MEIFSPNYNILLEVFDQELGNCRLLHDERTRKVCHNVQIDYYVLVGS